MTTTVYEMEIKEQLNSEFRTEQRIALVNFYERFVERKLQIYVTENQMAETTNSSVFDILEVLKQIHLKYFLKCALLETVPPPMLKLLQNKKMEEERQQFLAKYRLQKKNV